MRLRRLLNAPEFPVILAPYILFAPILFGKALFWGTPALQFHPWHVFAWETLKSGQLPLWNPLSGLGAPLIANYQSALFYPPNWIYFLLGGVGGEVAMAWGMGLLAAAHLSLAGVGMVRLARELGLSAVAQTVCGLAFGLSGYLVARAHFLSVNAAVAWLPWVLWASYRLVKTGAAGSASAESNSASGMSNPLKRIIRAAGISNTGFNQCMILAFLIGMLLLAGHAQTAWYTLLLAGVWVIFWSLPRSPLSTLHSQPSTFHFPHLLIRALFLFSLSLLIGLALSAVQLLPTAELLSQSQRSGGADYDFVMTYSFWPWRFLGLVAPGFFGSPATGDYWGYGNFWEDAIYIGLLPLFLAFRTLRNAAFRTSNFELRTSIRLPQFLWLIVLIAFLFALGQNTPIFPFLYRYIPTFDLFQAPTRYTIWAVFALALLAGIGAETWNRPVGKKARAHTLRGMVIAGAVVIAALTAGQVIPGIEPSFIRATALAGALGVGIGIFSLFAPKPKENAYSHAKETKDDPNQLPITNYQLPVPNLQPPITNRPLPITNYKWSWLVASFLTLDLLLAGWGLNPGIPLDFYQGREKAGQIRDMLDGGRLFLPAEDEYDLTFDRYLRFDSFHTDFTHFRASLLPNLTLLDGIPSANNFDPLRPARYVQWMYALETAGEAQQQQMLAMMGVTAIERYASDSEMAVSFEAFEGNPRFQWFPCAWPAYDGENAWELLFENPPELDREFVVLEGYATAAEGAAAQWVCGEAAEAEIQLVSETPNEIRLQVEADSSGWLLIADTWYPGWQAEVNEEEVPVYRANYLFRAVDVPAGGGEVVMRYRPVGFMLGVVVSVMALVVGIILIVGKSKLSNG